ncbi:hypothetical protein GCK32_010161 [Trichostrongylus colubriformis]|uniref:Core Histone H2A/H2B/H3 domain-containing protein n=1 Tax=Trichostrongylus colubriformis TaxID=6319 RepID=A0AAN8IM20_TRICO
MTSHDRAQKPSSKEDGRRGEKKKKRGRKEEFSVYIYRVLKGIYPDTGISSKSMSIMNSFVNDIVERFAAESARLVRYNNRTTITPRDINSAARLVLSGEIATQAVSHSRQALAKYDAIKQNNLRPAINCLYLCIIFVVSFQNEMAMDTVFDFDNQEYVSDVRVFRVEELRHPTKQYNFDKDDGRGRMALPKKPHLICTNSLLTENEKKRNPQYKSIVLRSMQYDRFDTSVICHSVRKKKGTSDDAVTGAGAIIDKNNRATMSSGGCWFLQVMHVFYELPIYMEEDIVLKLEVNDSALTNVHTSLDSHMDSLARKSAQSALHSSVDHFYNPYEDHSPMTTVEGVSNKQSSKVVGFCALNDIFRRGLYDFNRDSLFYYSDLIRASFQ